MTTFRPSHQAAGRLGRQTDEDRPSDPTRLTVGGLSPLPSLRCTTLASLPSPAPRDIEQDGENDGVSGDEPPVQRRDEDRPFLTKHGANQQKASGPERGTAVGEHRERPGGQACRPGDDGGTVAGTGE